MLGHLLRYRTEQQSGEFRAPATTDNDQVNTVFVSVVDDLFGGMAHADFEMRLDFLLSQGGFELGQHPTMVTARVLDDGFGLDIVGYVRRARDGQHEQLRAMLNRQATCGFEGLFRGVRAVVSNEDLAIHASP